MRNPCSTCLWWDRVGGSDAGECHRYAPTPYSLGLAVWPRTVSTQGCGDWMQRPVPPPSSPPLSPPAPATGTTP